jgi:cell wall-associated NlpC family hydrolase
MATAPLQPLPGDFAVVRILGDVGRLIRVGQWLDGDGYENYEHAFIDVGDGQLVEAQPHGARLASLSDYDGRTPLWSTGCFPLTDDQRACLVAAARSYIGVPYSFLDYGSLALARFHVRPPVVTRYIADTHHMICSQLVDQCYVDAGVHLFTDGRFPGDVTPGNLYELIRAAQR